MLSSMPDLGNTVLLVHVKLRHAHGLAPVDIRWHGLTGEMYVGFIMT